MAIKEIPKPSTPPIQKYEDGVFRVGGTRVRLETVITAFQNGCTAGEILLKYPSLDLADIYAVITYYLQHPDAVEEYLSERRQLIEQVDQEIEERFPSAGVCERLLARSKGNPLSLGSAFWQMRISTMPSCAVSFVGSHTWI